MASDRIEDLKAKRNVTGIDFIYVHPGQVRIDVFLFHDPLILTPQIGIGSLGEVRIYSPSGAAEPIPIINRVFNGNVLELETAYPGNFALYKLKIDDARIDPYYNNVSFSFKANCPSDLDCKPPAHECSPDEEVDFPIDYSARDFWSYRQALLEFASLRYPNWSDRLPADAGVMLAEVMSAVGDEMAYYQDRISREAYLETASQRRSLRRHSRLVDYHIQDNLGSFVWIDVTVKETMSGDIIAGTNFWVKGENGVRTDFEVASLKDAINGEMYSVDANRNEFKAYRWDEDQVCLPIGATELYLEGAHDGHLLNFAGSTPDHDNGKWVLLKTSPANPAQPKRAHMVRLIQVEDRTDPVYGIPVTYLKWDEKQALPFEMDMLVLVVRGNLIPATSGRIHTQYFITGAELDKLPPAEKTSLEADAELEEAPIVSAVEREGNNDNITYLCSLVGSEDRNLVWLKSETQNATSEIPLEEYDRATAVPEIYLEELEFTGAHWEVAEPTWEWKRSLVGINSSKETETHYTLDDGSWRRVVGYWRKGKEIVHYDYASGDGTTIRFGNGLFGTTPDEKTVFKVYYRLGGGNAANVAPETITQFDDHGLDFVESVTNPLSGINGKDPETANHIRQSAPEAFRTITYRAVRPEDYAEAAERLDWVQRAGASFRWTGSWLTAFVTPDPKNAVVLTDEQRAALFEQLNRFRQAGREAFYLDPRYADIDLEMEICASPGTYRGELKERIMIRLFGKKGIIPVKGFFSPDHFTFGNLLERSQLEAAIQEVSGVKAVESIRFRRRGVFDWKVFNEYSYDPGKDSIIRVENDPLHPERGTLKIYIHGGA